MIQDFEKLTPFLPVTPNPTLNGHARPSKNPMKNAL